MEPTTSGGSTRSSRPTSRGDSFNASEFYQREQRAANAVKPGLNPKEKFGAAKPDPTLVPPALVLYAALAMAVGAGKYGPYNWRDGKRVNARTYIAACMRHLLAWQDGEELDESGRPHLAHAAASLAILIDALENGNLYDDRGSAGPASKIIRKYTRPIDDGSFDVVTPQPGGKDA